jgi:hypothetical protein
VSRLEERCSGIPVISTCVAATLALRVLARSRWLCVTRPGSTRNLTPLVRRFSPRRVSRWCSTPLVGCQVTSAAIIPRNCTTGSADTPETADAVFVGGQRVSRGGGHQRVRGGSAASGADRAPGVAVALPCCSTSAREASRIRATVGHTSLNRPALKRSPLLPIAPHLPAHGQSEGTESRGQTSR